MVQWYNDVVECPYVTIELENETISSHDLVSGASKASGTIHMIGTKVDNFVADLANEANRVINV